MWNDILKADYDLLRFRIRIHQTLSSELIRDDKDDQQHKEEKCLLAFPLTIYPQTFALPSNKASNEEVVLIREKVSLP